MTGNRLGFVRSASGWIADRLITIGLSLLVQLALVRSLGTSGFGELSYLLAFSAILSPLAIAGASGFVARALLDVRHEQARIVSAAIAWRMAGGGISILLALIYWVFIEDASRERAILLLLAISQTALVFQVIEVYFQSRFEQTALLRWRLPAQILGAGLKIVIAVETADLFWVALAFCFDFLLQGAAYAFAYFRHTESWPVPTRDSRWTPWLQDRAPWLLASAIAETIYLKIDILMLEHFLGAAETGIYSAATKLSEIWYFLPTVIMSAWFPLIWSDGKSQSADIRKLQRTMDLFMLAAASVALIIQFSGERLTLLLFGDEFSSSAGILKVHIWAGVFVFMRTILSKWLIAEDLPRHSLMTHLLGAAVNVALNLVLIPQHGAIGAAYATVISYATASWLALYASPRTRSVAHMMTLSLLLPFRWKAIVFYGKSLFGLLK